MWGAPIEIDHKTTEVVIAFDGAKMPLAEGY